MDSTSRLIPYAWKYRYQLLFSAFLALIVALLWGLNLSVTFPLVKVLLEGESLEQYVQGRITELNVEIETRETQLQELNDEQHNAAARTQEKLSSANHSLAMFVAIQDWVLPWVPDDRFDTFAAMLGLLFFVACLKCVFAWTQEVVIGAVVQRCVMRIRQDALRHVLRLDLQTVSTNGTSDLLARFTNDSETLVGGLSLLGVRLVREPLKALACIGFAFFLNWRLTLLAVLVVPLLLASFHRFGKRLKKASRLSLESMSRMYKLLAETLESFKIVTAFSAASRHRHQFHLENREFYRQYMKVVRVGALMSPTTELVGMIAVFMALLPAAYLVLRGVTSIWGIKLATSQLDVSDLSVLYALLAGTLDPIRKLSGIFRHIKASAAACDRVFGIMDLSTQVAEPACPRRLPETIRSIRFEGVVFSYADRKNATRKVPPVLKGVSLDIRKGDVVAVIGTNGSGKSTLINMLPRFYDCSEGAVLFDDVDVRNVQLRELRSRIGLVTQETLLFDTTIYNNILYGRPHATHEEVEHAAAHAHVTQFLEQLPDGFDTVVGERGQSLSGGQRQRIALARAILKDPEILILDEATSAIDHHSEQLIHKALQEFSRERTVFIISHVLSQTFVDLVTRIVVLDDGKVIGDGTHLELLTSCDRYRSLCQIHHRAA
ncbi:ATP-binding cassette domain-containing protein [bacterium]|nr:ATP-binding cassette domain-containing protein [bacterium]